MKTISQILTELELDENSTFDDIMNKLTLVTQDEINDIKTVSVKVLPNVSRDKATEIKDRLVNTIIDDDKGSNAILNKRLALLSLLLSNNNADVLDLQTNKADLTLIYANSISLSGSSGTLTDAQLNVITTFKNPVVYYDDGVSTHTFHLMGKGELATDVYMYAFGEYEIDTTTNQTKIIIRHVVINATSKEWYFELIDKDHYNKSKVDSLVSTLQGNINSEANTRSNADTNLQGQINGIKSELGYVELDSSNDFGTLTDEQYNECLKKYCIIKYGNYFYIKESGTSSSSSIYFVGNTFIRSNNLSDSMKSDFVTNYISIVNFSKTWNTTTRTLTVYKTTSIDSFVSNLQGNIDAEANARTSGLATKVAYDDVKNVLTDTSTNKPLSAYQGKVLKGMIDTINTLLASDDTSLDTVQEIITYIKSNKSLIDTLSSNKINFTDIVDNLTSELSNKPLSAKQGYVLKGYIDTINDAEEGIATAEGLRVTAENGRVQAENARVLAEQARATEFAGWESTLAGKEVTSNKVTELSSSSTDTQYPSAKVVYDGLSAITLSGDNTSVEINSKVISVKDSYVENFFATSEEIDNMLSEVFN